MGFCVCATEHWHEQMHIQVTISINEKLDGADIDLD